MAQKLGQLQPFLAVFPPERTGQPAYFGASLDTLASSPQVLWDNRRMLHRACPYPTGEERVFHGARRLWLCAPGLRPLNAPQQHTVLRAGGGCGEQK